MYFQTGDVLYFKSDVTLVPKDFKKIKSNLIHQGQNHQHIIKGDFNLFVKDNEMFIQANKQCSLEHGEHKPIKLPKGLYKKKVVVEFDHFLNESREVID